MFRAGIIIGTVAAGKTELSEERAAEKAAEDAMEAAEEAAEIGAQGEAMANAGLLTPDTLKMMTEQSGKELPHGLTYEQALEQLMSDQVKMGNFLQGQGDMSVFDPHGPDVGSDHDWAAHEADVPAMQGADVDVMGGTMGGTMPDMSKYDPDILAELTPLMTQIQTLSFGHESGVDAAKDAEIKAAEDKIKHSMTEEQYKLFLQMSVDMMGPSMSQSSWDDILALPEKLQDVALRSLTDGQFEVAADLAGVVFPGGLTAQTAFPQVEGDAEKLRKVLMKKDISVLDVTKPAPVVDGPVEVTDAKTVTTTAASNALAATVSGFVVAAALAFW